MESRDPSTNVILLEDTAAVLGVIIAATCMGLTSITGKYFLNYTWFICTNMWEFSYISLNNFKSVDC